MDDFPLSDRTIFIGNSCIYVVLAIVSDVVNGDDAEHLYMFKIYVVFAVTFAIRALFAKKK